MLDIRPHRFATVATAALLLGLGGLSACQQAAEDTTEAVSMETSEDILAEATATDAAVADAASDATTTYDDSGTTVTAAVTSTAAYRITDGDRTFYYRKGEDSPYLARRGEEYYSFKNGTLDRVLDSGGRELTDRRDAVRSEAEGWSDRGRDLKEKAEPRLPAQSQTQQGRTQSDRTSSTGGSSGQTSDRGDRARTGGERSDAGTPSKATQGARGATENTGNRNPEGAGSRQATGRTETTSSDTRTRTSRQTDTDEKAPTTGERPGQRAPTPPAE